MCRRKDYISRLRVAAFICPSTWREFLELTTSSICAEINQQPQHIPHVGNKLLHNSSGLTEKHWRMVIPGTLQASVSEHRLSAMFTGELHKLESGLLALDDKDS